MTKPPSLVNVYKQLHLKDYSKFGDNISYYCMHIKFVFKFSHALYRPRLSILIGSKCYIKARTFFFSVHNHF